MAASFLSQPTIVRLPNLLEMVRDRQIVIPRFQRPFIWTDQQRVELMESIYSGIPIGSLLVWRTQDQGLQTYRLRGTSSDQVEAGPRQYLLDGHQRVITLFTVLGPGLLTDMADEQTNTPIITDDDDYDDLRPLYFDLESKEFRAGLRRGSPSPAWLPLDRLFDDYFLYESQQSLAQRKDGRGLINRARMLHKIFYDYTIAIVPIITDNLEIATKSFERVNNAGTTMTEVHMVAALTYIKGFDLNQRLQDIREELGAVGWQELEAQMILNVCKAQLDLDIYPKSSSSLAMRLKDDRDALDKARDALVLAAEFLARACGIYGPQTLPYSYQVVLLADVLWRHREEQAEELDDQLATWLWATTYGEYFASMSSTRLRNALEHLRAVADGNEAPLPRDLPDEILPPRRFDFRAARSRVIALTMADLEPVSPTGKAYKSSHYAHQLLARHGRHAIPKILPRNMVGGKRAESFENRIIAPPRKADALLHALHKPNLFDFDAQALRSHGITKDAAKALRGKKYDRFLDLRRAFLIDQERAFVESLGLRYVDE